LRIAKRVVDDVDVPTGGHHDTAFFLAG
jgi:hypothetical protein